MCERECQGCLCCPRVCIHKRGYLLICHRVYMQKGPHVFNYLRYRRQSMRTPVTCVEKGKAGKHMCKCDKYEKCREWLHPMTIRSGFALVTRLALKYEGGHTPSVYNSSTEEYTRVGCGRKHGRHTSDHAPTLAVNIYLIKPLSVSRKSVGEKQSKRQKMR